METIRYNPQRGIVKKANVGQINKGPTASLGDFQNPCFLGGNSRKVHENFLEKKKKSITP